MKIKLLIIATYLLMSCDKPYEPIPPPQSISEILPHPGCKNGEIFNYEWNEKNTPGFTYNTASFVCKKGWWEINSVIFYRPTWEETEKLLKIR